MKKLFLLSIFLLIVTQAIRAGEPKLIFRVYATKTNATIEEKTNIDQINEKIDFGSSIGGGFGFEFKPIHLVGLDINIAYSEADIDSKPNFPDTDICFCPCRRDGEYFWPITVGLNFHLNKNQSIDFFIGPMFGLVQYGGSSSSQSISNSHNAYGANIGFDIPLKNKKWSLNSSLKYLKTSIDGVFINDHDVDSYIFQIGMSYRKY